MAVNEPVGIRKVRCGPCANDGQEVVAVERYCLDCQQYLCTECIRYHRVLKVLTKHTLVAIDDDRVSKSGHIGTKGKCSHDADNESDSSTDVTRCTRHPQETVEYFCNSCATAGCKECVAQSHSGCNAVQFPVEYLCGAIDSDSVFNDIDTSFSELQENIGSVEKASKTLSEEVNTRKTRLSTEIESFKADIDDLSKVFTQLLGKTADYIRDKEKNYLNSVNRKLEEIQKLREAVNSAEDGRLDDLVKDTVNQVNQIRQSLTDKSNPEKSEHSLSEMEKVGKFIDVVREFGTSMDHQPLDLAARRGQRFDSPSDHLWGKVTGVIATSNKVVVADCSNKKVKIIDTEKQDVIAEIYLPVLFRET